MKTLYTILFLVITSHVYSQVNLASSLTACYALNGTATEPINALNGLLSGPTPTANRFNTPNSALYFNGDTQYVKLPNHPLLKPADAISFSCWIYGTVQTNCYILFTQNNLGSNFEAYELCVEPNMTFMTRKSGPAGLNQVNSTTQYQINTWNHLAMTIDNSFVKLYVNGQLEASTASTFNGFDYMQGNNVYLGASNSFYDGPFTGIIDNARFYNRTLSAAEVLALFNTDPTCLAANAPVATFSVPSPACAGSTLQLMGASTNTPTQWQWTVPGGSTTNSLTQNPVYTFTSAGVYGATLQVSNVNGMSSTSANFTIHPVPQLLAAASKTITCKYYSISLTASGASTYTWLPMNVTSPTFTYVIIYNQTFSVTGTSTAGCVATKTLLVKSAYCEGSVAEQTMADQIKIVYDGSSQTLQLKGMDESAYRLRIYSSDAKLVFDEPKGMGTEYLVRTSNYESGIYLLVIENDTYRVCKKVFVQ